jgi:hypothetical protein
VVNKRAGRANTLFGAYAPPDEYRIENERLPWICSLHRVRELRLSAGKMLEIGPSGLTISCADKMTPARYGGRGDGS